MARIDYNRHLQRKLRSMFPDERLRESVLEILDTYGEESHEQEQDRVRLAILKVSGCSLGEIMSFTELAKKDFRDVLSMAEYPRQSRVSLPEGPEMEELVKADLEDYLAWLEN